MSLIKKIYCISMDSSGREAIETRCRVSELRTKPFDTNRLLKSPRFTVEK